MASAYFAPLVLLPTIIDGVGRYITRTGDTVDITTFSSRHSFECQGKYANGVLDRWHKSGRIFASFKTDNDIVGRE